MEELMRILGELHPDVDFNTADDLIGDGVLDSLNSAYDVSIPAEEILPENFRSAKAIYGLITRLDEA